MREDLRRIPLGWKVVIVILTLFALFLFIVFVNMCFQLRRGEKVTIDPNPFPTSMQTAPAFPVDVKLTETVTGGKKTYGNAGDTVTAYKAIGEMLLVRDAAGQSFSVHKRRTTYAGDTPA